MSKTITGLARSLTVTGKSADFRGNGHPEDGTTLTFELTAVDNGSGTSDTVSVGLSNGYTAGGNLIRGDVQILTQ